MLYYENIYFLNRFKFVYFFNFSYQQKYQKPERAIKIAIGASLMWRNSKCSLWDCPVWDLILLNDFHVYALLLLVFQTFYFFSSFHSVPERHSALFLSLMTERSRCSRNDHQSRRSEVSHHRQLYSVWTLPLLQGNSSALHLGPRADLSTVAFHLV